MNNEKLKELISFNGNEIEFKSYEEIYEVLKESFISIYSKDKNNKVYIDSTSPDGIYLHNLALIFHNMFCVINEIQHSHNPEYAEGKALDKVLNWYGFKRYGMKPAKLKLKVVSGNCNLEITDKLLDEYNNEWIIKKFDVFDKNIIYVENDKKLYNISKKLKFRSIEGFVDLEIVEILSYGRNQESDKEFKNRFLMRESSEGIEDKFLRIEGVLDSKIIIDKNNPNQLEILVCVSNEIFKKLKNKEAESIKDEILATSFNYTSIGTKFLDNIYHNNYNDISMLLLQEAYEGSVIQDIKATVVECFNFEFNFSLHKIICNEEELKDRIKNLIDLLNNTPFQYKFNDKTLLKNIFYSADLFNAEIKNFDIVNNKLFNESNIGKLRFYDYEITTDPDEDDEHNSEYYFVYIY